MKRWLLQDEKNQRQQAKKLAKLDKLFSKKIIPNALKKSKATGIQIAKKEQYSKKQLKFASSQPTSKQYSRRVESYSPRSGEREREEDPSLKKFAQKEFSVSNQSSKPSG